jgi:hypothetical protein
MNYDKVQANAYQILSRYGLTISITKRVAGGYDTATGSAIETLSVETGKGTPFNYLIKNIDGTLIKEGDQQLFISPRGISKPQVNDEVTVNGIKFTIMSVKEINPGGTSLLYDCNIRP